MVEYTKPSMSPREEREQDNLKATCDRQEALIDFLMMAIGIDTSDDTEEVLNNGNEI